jgi:hypothetical protein
MTALAPLVIASSCWLGDSSAFAASLAFLGDVNGDKASDVLVGSPSDGSAKVGKVFVFSGRDGELLLDLDGPAASSGFGIALDALGDVDGDGFPDFAVGAPNGDAGMLHTRGPGFVQILSGRDGSRLRALEPLPDERSFGADLAALDDLDGDRHEDLLVRARAGAGEKEHERFVAFSSATGARLFAVDSPAGVFSHDLGDPIARLPDVDGDSTPDFAVEYGGNVQVLSGKEGKHVATLSSPLPPDAKSAFGFSICGIPGKPVLVAVGDPREGGYGSIHVLPIVLGEGEESLAASETAQYMIGDDDFAGVGCSLALAGDIDRDGRPDIVAGLCDGRRGGAFVLASDDLEVSLALKAADRAAGEAKKDEAAPKGPRIPFGWRVASGRDIDGDGTPDVAVARHWPAADPASQRSVVLFSGRDGRRLREILPPVEPGKSK